MARVAGVDLPPNKRAEIGLTYIYGIGRSRSASILKEANVNVDTRVRDLTEEDLGRIRAILESQGEIEGDLRKRIQMDIKRLMDIGAYRGLRHRRGLPVRGQRTHTNARTRKGPRRATIAKKKVFRKKEKKNIPSGIVYIAASFNNTMISITDLEGNLIAQSSSGARGFRGSRKGTPFAAQQAAYEAAKKAIEAGMQQAEVRVKGPGGGRESAIRAINNAGIRVVAIRDTTPIPHNGCRPPKRRRV